MPKSSPHDKKNPLEVKIDNLSSSLQVFIDAQFATSVLLFVCIIIAILLSNLKSTTSFYHAIVNLPFEFHLGDTVFKTTVHDFVNDFLLTFFFFVLGLEIKREFVVGELSDISKALYILLCAIGGVLLPISTYLALNYHNPETIHGWAIPMATDTALAIGVLYLFKKSISNKVFILIASIAVIDDILSIFVIALFYSTHLSFSAFLVSIILFLCLMITNLCGFRHPIIYAIQGLLLWFSIEQAGIHGTIAGVLTAMVIPARPRKKPKKAVNKIRHLIDKFEDAYDDKKHLLEESKPHKLLERVKDASLDATTPLKRWENRLELPVLLFILPLFALTSGGFSLEFTQMSMTFKTTLFWGIFLGLVLAKPIGILVTSLFIQSLNIASPPKDVSQMDIFIIASLAGIGYTMSIFISELSFDVESIVSMSKLSIFVSSIVSALIGIFLIQYKKSLNN